MTLRPRLKPTVNLMDYTKMFFNVPTHYSLPFQTHLISLWFKEKNVEEKIDYDIKISMLNVHLLVYVVDAESNQKEVVGKTARVY